MFTQCPECSTVHKITARQLRQGRGIFRCKTCRAQFDALQFINDKAPKKQRGADYGSEPQLFLEKSQAQADKKFWLWGLGSALLLLLGQIIYFEGSHTTQNPMLRPWFEGICSTLHCTLPAYRNPAELEILHSSFKQRDDQNYRLLAAIANRAPFAQPYPQLKLTLKDYSGEAFAERIFMPQDYLPQNPQALITSGSAEEIALDISEPQTPVGGFSLKLQ